MRVFRTFFSLLFLCGITSAREVEVINYNIRYDAKDDTGERDWNKRKSSITNFLQNGEIIGLQEALSHQLKDIKKTLPHHQSVGVGRDDGKAKGEFTPILFDSRKWQVDPEQNGTFWLSDTPHEVASKSWGNQIPRICTWVRLIDDQGAGLYIFNTHWDHKSEESRNKATNLILTKLQQRHYIDEPAILLGDLNATTESSAVKKLLEYLDLRKRNHLVNHCEEKATYNNWNPNIQEGLRIDHIFTSPFLPVRSCKVVSVGKGESTASDHHALHAIIKWNSQAHKEMLDRIYLKETVLGKEHGEGSGIIVRWGKPATVRAIGGNKEQHTLLKSVLLELNDALHDTGMHYTLTEEVKEHELRIYFAESSTFKEIGEKETIDVHDNIDGFAALSWNTETKEILHAVVLIATDKTEGQFQRHILLEEITQTLGLMGDTTVFPESVTYARYEDQGSAPKLGKPDINALRLIYGHLNAGDDSLRTGIAYGRHWGK